MFFLISQRIRYRSLAPYRLHQATSEYIQSFLLQTHPDRSIQEFRQDFFLRNNSLKSDQYYLFLAFLIATISGVILGPH